MDFVIKHHPKPQFMTGLENVIATVAVNINGAEEMIKMDRHVSYREMWAALGIAKSQIQTILHEQLVVKKLCNSWIPYDLTEAQKIVCVNWYKKNAFKIESWCSFQRIQYHIRLEYLGIMNQKRSNTTVWVFQSEQKPTKVVHSRNASKKIIILFFRKTRCVVNVTLEGQKTVNADCYLFL